jgi:hypothetical protein
MMRRVKMRDSMRGAMESSSVMSVSTRISGLIDSAMKESCAALANIHDKALILEDRQVTHKSSQRNELTLLRTNCSTTSIAFLLQSTVGA